MRAWLSPTAWWKCDVDAGGGQLLAQPGGVGVGDLAEQQLGAHRDDLDPHGGDLTGRPVVHRPAAVEQYSRAGVRG